MKRQVITLCATLCATMLFAEPPANYYSSVNGKTGDNIRLALSSIISNHTNVGYDGLYDVYAKADMREDGRTLWDMYSDCEFTIDDTNGSNATVCGCYNREHSLPKSWWGGNKAAQYSDAYHVVPTDCRVNNQRSAYAFGECAGGTRLSVKARGKLGASTFTGYNGTVFEPDDEYKGDFARHYFYMITAYPNVSFTSSNGSAIFADAGRLTSYGLALLLKWHRMDPVSKKELNRNDAVSSFQRNRNPFIDYPCLVEYIWGDRKNEAIDINSIMSAYSPEYAASDLTGCYNQPTSPTILTPQAGSEINLGQASLNKTTSRDINVTAALLTQPVTLSISGKDASLFSVSTATIPANIANEGTNITINYTPASLGNHTATLTLSSAGANSVSVNLKGSCTSSLTNPSTDIYLTNNYVGLQLQFNIRVEGTNLSNDISLELISGQDIFALSQNTVSAAQAMEGYNLTAYYTPTESGKHTARLVITSPDFEARAIDIHGSCQFEVLPATFITYHSAQLNWTNAGVTDYIVDLYQKSVSGTEETLILTDNCESTQGSTDGYTAVEKGGLRLGSGSTIGSLTFSGLDLTKGGRIEFEAMYYNQDNCPVSISLAGSELATQQLTNEFATYSIEVPAHEQYANATLKFSSTEKSKRVIIKSVNVYAGGETTENVSLPGYPMHVGNVLSYVVDNLDSLTEYYFTIQPVGQDVSEEWMFMTDNSNLAALSDIYEGITYTLTPEGIELNRLQDGISIEVYDAIGRLITRRTSSNYSEHINLPQGFFLIKAGQQTIRIIH